MKDRLLDWIVPVFLIIAVFAIATLISHAIRNAETKIRDRCAGDVRVYYGTVAGDGVLAVNPYDSECYDHNHPDVSTPTYPGDSHTRGKS